MKMSRFTVLCFAGQLSSGTVDGVKVGNGSEVLNTDKWGLSVYTVRSQLYTFPLLLDR